MTYENDVKEVMKKANPPENVIADFLQNEVKEAFHKTKLKTK